MQSETLKKINELLKSFNDTFKVDANIVEEDHELVIDGLKITGLKNDGSNFVTSFHETFNTIVKSLSDEHEVIYNEDKGLVIAKKVVKTEFLIEDEF